MGPRGLRLTQFSHEGLRFDVTDEGDEAGRVVVLLHGFPADRHCWDGIASSLHRAGYRTLAPDQRGYSPGARPRSRRAYRVAALTSDVLALADAAGAGGIDVVGHDWGAAVAWDLAVRHPDQVRSLAAFSVPHPAAFAAALHHSEQLRRAWYMAAFQVPVLPELLLGLCHGSLLRRHLERSGLDPASAARYAQRAQDRALSGPLGWYRGLVFDLGRTLSAVEVPALFAWGDDDHFVTGQAAGACRAWMHGPARSETLHGVSHWIPEVAPKQAAELLIEHLGTVTA